MSVLTSSTSKPQSANCSTSWTLTVKGYGAARASASPNTSAPSTGSTFTVGTTMPAGRKARSFGLARMWSTTSSAWAHRGTGLMAVKNSHC